MRQPALALTTALLLTGALAPAQAQVQKMRPGLWEQVMNAQVQVHSMEGLRSRQLAVGTMKMGLDNLFNRRYAGTLTDAIGPVRGEARGNLLVLEYTMEGMLRYAVPDEISNNIFQRMRAERTAVAKEHRARGMEQAEIIRADVDARVTVMVAEAERNSRTTRGEGDALAAKVYAEAYNKNAEFFSFVRSMEAYRKSFSSKDDILVVQPDNEFFKYMKSDQVQN